MIDAVESADRTRHIVFVSDAVATLAAASSTPPVPRRSPPLSAGASAALDPGTTRFFERLFERRGLNMERYRHAVLARRERACLRALGAASIEEAEAALAREELVERGLEAVMIGVTSFFRDEPVYAALRDVVRTRLITRPGGLRVLSVGCSDGAELYSLAILLAELGVPTREMAGVDCRRAAIDQARSGIYSRDSLANVPGGLRSRYFDDARDSTDRVQARTPLRERCRWWMGDAFTLPAAQPYDIVACRNLAIYLEPAAARELWALLWEHTRVGGILMVGKAERPDRATGFRRIGPCLYERQ